jgi:hypothetical protein
MVTSSRPSVLFLFLLIAASSPAFVDPRKEPKHGRDGLRCKRAEAKLSANSCENLSLGCGDVRVCCQGIADGGAALSVARPGHETGPSVNAKLADGESTAFAYRGHVVWLTARVAAEAAPQTTTVNLTPHPCPSNDREKIESLISLIESMDGAVFIRNDKEYPAKDAAEHLRSKYAWKKDEIATVDDFIENAASRSSASGKEYQIRVAGVAKSSGQFLREKLRLIDSVCAGDSPREGDKRRE